MTISNHISRRHVLAAAAITPATDPVCLAAQPRCPSPNRSVPHRLAASEPFATPTSLIGTAIRVAVTKTFWSRTGPP
jgi:hypothetical protein